MDFATSRSSRLEDNAFLRLEFVNDYNAKVLTSDGIQAQATLLLPSFGNSSSENNSLKHASVTSCEAQPAHRLYTIEKYQSHKIELIQNWTLLNLVRSTHTSTWFVRSWRLFTNPLVHKSVVQVYPF